VALRGCAYELSIARHINGIFQVHYWWRTSGERRVGMTTASYSRLAGAVFALVALLQLVRALAGWPITIADTMIPLWASWVACVVAGGFAWLGLTASRA